MAPIRRAAPRPDFASHPSDLELINTYLIPWVNTGDRPWSFIHDADVYAAKPQDLARNFAPATASDGLEGWYFFSTLRSKNRRGQRKSRTVGSEGDDGCWHSERAAKPLYAGINHSRQIGYRQTFSFATKGDGRLLRSGWLMAEIGLNSDGSEDDELVLCKVYRSPRVKRSTAAEAAAGPPRVGRGKAAASDHSAPCSQQVGKAGPRAHLPSARVSASTSGTLSMESDSEQDSTSQGGGLIGTSPSATPPRRPSPRLIADGTARSEAPRAPQIPFLPSSPIRRTSAAPGPVAAAAAPRPDFACHPSDQALVQSYLIPRIASGLHPCKFTHDADVYAAGPDALTTQFPPAISGDGEKAWYIFTTLPAKSTHGQRRPRTVATGEGCWHSEAGVKPVVDGDHHQIGWRQFFSFMTKDAGRSTRTGWIMVEIGLEQQEGLTDELVLCKVYRSPRKGPAPTALESSAPAASGRSKRRADDNNSGAALTLGTAPKESTATTPPSGRKKRKTGGDSSPGTRGPARGVLKLTTPPTASGCKKQGDKKKARLCTRCRIETAESDSGTSEDDDTEDDETRGGSGTGILEHDSITDESAAPHGHEAGDSSASARTFYRFV